MFSDTHMMSLSLNPLVYHHLPSEERLPRSQAVLLCMYHGWAACQGPLQALHLPTDLWQACAEADETWGIIVRSISARYEPVSNVTWEISSMYLIVAMASYAAMPLCHLAGGCVRRVHATGPRWDSWEGHGRVAHRFTVECGGALKRKRMTLCFSGKKCSITMEHYHFDIFWQ